MTIEIAVFVFAGGSILVAVLEIAVRPQPQRFVLFSNEKIPIFRDLAFLGALFGWPFPAT
jgi:hypothetical protein